MCAIHDRQTCEIWLLRAILSIFTIAAESYPRDRNVDCPSRSRVLRRSIVRSINALAGIAHYITDVFTTHRLSRLSRTQRRVYTVTRRQNKLAEWRASVFREDPLPARRRRAPPCLPSGAVDAHREFRTRFARVRSRRGCTRRAATLRLYRVATHRDALRRANRDRIARPRSLRDRRLREERGGEYQPSLFSKLAAIFRKTERQRKIDAEGGREKERGNRNGI